MKRVFVVTILLLAMLSVSIFGKHSEVSAHPIDIAFVILNVADDQLGKPLPSNEVYGYVSLNWVTAAGLLGYINNPDQAVDVLDEKQPFFDQYFNEKLQISNNGKACKISSDMIEVPDSQLFYLNGLEFHLRVLCEENLASMEINNRILVDEFPNQTNVMSIYDVGGKLVYTDTLTASNSQLSINVERQVESENSDAGSNEGSNEKGSRSENSAFTQLNSNAVGNQIRSLGQKTMEGVASMLNSSNPWSRVGVLLLVMILGALHSFEGGHNKVILATMMMNGEVNLRGSMLYVFIFTLTHMSDIIILAVGLVIFNQYLNLYSLIPYIQQFSIAVLLVMSAYITIKELIILRRKRREQAKNKSQSSDNIDDLFKTDNEVSQSEVEFVAKHEGIEVPKKKRGSSTFREQFVVAFVAGLAPCLTGWTVFILIVSSGYIWLLFPATVAFGVGVFSVLATFTFIIYRFRGGILHRYSSIADYAPLASGVLLLAVTLFALF